MGQNLKHTLYEGDWLRLVRIGHWEACERTHGQGMAVIVIAVTPADEVLFVEQHRIPLGARTIVMRRRHQGARPTPAGIADVLRER